jgi:hypothetical protein
MARWSCPRCDREFGKTNQSHTCIPGGSIDDTFRGKPPEQRAIYDAVAAHLKTLGRVHADAVQVGVFLKTDRKLAELRPKSKWLSCNLYMATAIDDPRVARSLRLASERYVNEVKLRTVDDVDEQVREWLTAAFDENTD